MHAPAAKISIQAGLTDGKTAAYTTAASAF
jgi:hypothetical protein